MFGRVLKKRPGNGALFIQGNNQSSFTANMPKPFILLNRSVTVKILQLFGYCI